MKITRRSALLSFLVTGLSLLIPSLRSEELSKQVARPVPTWLRAGVIYEVFPRNFSAEGNFNGITARLDELKDLGVDILWLMPIHPLGQKMRKGTIGSPYAVEDYYAINPEYGTEADLKRLVAEAHKRDLKVIIDIVANHTAWDSVMMQHPEFYKQDANGKIIPPVPEWTDVAGLNYDNPTLREYMITMLKHWIDPATLDLDGFRCDVAEKVPTSFWEEARAELTKVKPDIMMLAEASKPDRSCTRLMRTIPGRYTAPSITSCLMAHRLRNSKSPGMKAGNSSLKVHFTCGFLITTMSPAP